MALVKSLIGDSHFSFKVETELTVSDDSGTLALTKKLGFFRGLSVAWAKNVRIKKVMFMYEPRAGELGEGQITASIIDNRIDEDLSPNVLKTISFDVKQAANILWEHSVQLHVNDLRRAGEDPIIMKTSVSGCNMKPGFSIGHIVASVEIETYDFIKRGLRIKEATAKLSPLPIKRGADDSKIHKKTEKPVASINRASSSRYYLASP